MNYDGELTLETGECIDDWYIIEKAEHDGREWLEPFPGGASLMLSSRISDADIEGTGSQMLALAKAVLAGRAFHAKRCAAEPVENRWELWSPRNSQERGSVPDAVARRLAEKIVAYIGASALQTEGRAK